MYDREYLLFRSTAAPRSEDVSLSFSVSNDFFRFRKHKRSPRTHPNSNQKHIAVYSGRTFGLSSREWRRRRIGEAPELISTPIIVGRDPCCTTKASKFPLTNKYVHLPRILQAQPSEEPRYRSSLPYDLFRYSTWWCLLNHVNRKMYWTIDTPTAYGN